MKKLLSFAHALLALTAVSFGLAPQVSAQQPAGLYNPATGRLNTDTTAASTGITFVSYFITIWQALITVGGLLVIIYFLWGAIEWITAGGDSGKVGKARDKITQAVIGLVLLVGSFVIIAFLGGLFFGRDFDLFRMTFPTPDTARPAGGLPPLPPIPNGIN